MYFVVCLPIHRFVMYSCRSVKREDFQNEYYCGNTKTQDVLLISNAAPLSCLHAEIVYGELHYSTYL